LIVDKWTTPHSTDPANPDRGVPITLTAGVAYPIQMEFLRTGGGSGLYGRLDSLVELKYETHTIPLQPVALSRLSDRVSLPLAPTAPTLSNFDTTGIATFAWNSGSPNTATFTLEVSDDNVNFSRVRISDGPTGTTAEVEGLNLSQTYYFRVVAENAAGQAVSPSVAITMPSEPPPPPPVSGGEPDPCGEGTATIVIGTDANDHIRVTPASSSGAYQISINGAIFGPLSDGRIVIHGNDGDDDIQAAGSILTPVWVFGDAGNDRLCGGGNSSVLLGGDGNDELLGGAGRDLLIGGLGADRIIGNAGDDILIAGYTIHDDSLVSFCSIMDEWTRIDSDFATRIDHLDGPRFSGGLNGIVFLNSRTVHDDNAIDQIDVLTGSAGNDWYLYSLGNGDRATGVTATESGEAITSI
jgi:Ca2+-binding RTX toxin-like protein